MGSIRNTTLAGAAALAVAAIATAGAPVVSIDINGNLVNPGVGMATNETNVFNFTASDSGLNYLASWNFNATNSSASPLFVSGNFTFVNTSAMTQDFDVWVTLFTTPIGRPASLIGGSVAAGLTADFDGGTISSLGNAPMWEAYVDNNAVQPLLPAAQSASAGAFESVSVGSDQFGMPIPFQNGPALGNSMSIRLRFSLTSGDQASFTSVFVLESIPAPAGLALLGLAGFAGRRRRA